jgi:hypothetical protein
VASRADFAGGLSPSVQSLPVLARSGEPARLEKFKDNHSYQNSTGKIARVRIAERFKPSRRQKQRIKYRMWRYK